MPVQMKSAETDYLTGRALDWAVAICEGLGVRLSNGTLYFDGCDIECCYSTDWGEGGPIIDREHIEVRPTFTEGGYRTSVSVDAVAARIMLPNGATRFNPDAVVFAYGNTRLEAALRCYVKSKFGDVINLPAAAFND